MKKEYKIIDLRNLGGLSEAERLIRHGWNVATVDFDTITLKRWSPCLSTDSKNTAQKEGAKTAKKLTT